MAQPTLTAREEEEPLRRRASTPLRMSEDTIRVYRYAIVNPDWTHDGAVRDLGLSLETVERATFELTGLLLLRPSADPGRRFGVLSPEFAATALVEGAERRVQELQARIAAVRGEMLTLLPTYYEARRQRDLDEPVDLVDDPTVASQRLTAELAAAQREIHIACPGAMPADPGRVRLQVAALRRGVELSIVLQHSVRQHRPVSAQADALTGHGARVRTVSIVHSAVTVVDRRIAFIPADRDDPGRGSVVVREPAIVAQFLAGFDLMWDSGRGYSVDDGAAGAVEDDLRRAILRQMSAGVKDALIARRTAISLRTCRRHIADILTGLGAQSRFQAGVLAHRAGLVD